MATTYSKGIILCPPNGSAKTDGLAVVYQISIDGGATWPDTTPSSVSLLTLPSTIVIPAGFNNKKGACAIFNNTDGAALTIESSVKRTFFATVAGSRNNLGDTSADDVITLP